MKVNANWNQPQNLQKSENLSPSGVDDLKEQMFPDDDYSDLPFDIDPIFGDDELEVSAENSEESIAEEQASKPAVETHVSETAAAPVTSTSEAEVEVAPAPAPKKVEKKPVEKKTSTASKASKAKKSSGGTFKKHLKALRQHNEDLKAETLAQIENAIVEEDATEYVLPSDTKQFLIEMLQSEGLEVNQTSAGYSVNLLDL